jgi:hypothetical protein
MIGLSGVKHGGYWGIAPFFCCRLINSSNKIIRYFLNVIHVGCSPRYSLRYSLRCSLRCTLSIL